MCTIFSTCPVSCILHGHNISSGGIVYFMLARYIKYCVLVTLAQYFCWFGIAYITLAQYFVWGYRVSYVGTIHKIFCIGDVGSIFLLYASCVLRVHNKGCLLLLKPIKTRQKLHRSIKWTNVEHSQKLNKSHSWESCGLSHEQQTRSNNACEKWRQDEDVKIKQVVLRVWLKLNQANKSSC